jgi:hypothetical protein
MGMKWWNLTFDAQGLKIIIIVVHVGVVKVYVTMMEALRGKKKIGWNSIYTKIDGFLSFTPPPFGC